MKETARKILELVRNDFEIDASDISVKKWDEVFDELERQKLLLTMAQKGGHSLPYLLKSMLDSRSAFYVSRTNLYLETLEKLQQVADQEGLHFTLIKGLPLSYNLYSTPFGRQFNDLDILIDASDISRADYVIRSLGFVQPVGHKVTADDLYNQELSPYAFVRRRGEIQLSPYYAVISGVSLKVEIHFGLRCDVGNVLQRATLWKTEELCIGKTTVGIPNIVCQFLYLIINAYENSESVFSNQSNAKRGYRDFVDIHFFLRQYKAALCQRELEELVKALSLNPIIDVIGNDLLDVYPNDRMIWEELFGIPEAKSIWEDSFSDCLGTPMRRTMATSSKVLYSLDEPRSYLGFNKRATILRIMPGNMDDGEVSFEVKVSEDQAMSKSICVNIDSRLSKDLIFQFSFCCNVHGPKFRRYEINIYQSNGYWRAKAGWHSKICFGADIEKSCQDIQIDYSYIRNTHALIIQLPEMEMTRLDVLPCIFWRGKTGHPNILAFESSPAVFSLTKDSAFD